MARIGDLLLARGACSIEELREGLDNQAIFGGRLGTNLLETGAVSEEALAAALGAKFGVPWLAGDDFVCDRTAIALVPPELADRCNVVPYLLSGRKLSVLCIDPSAFGSLDEIAFFTNKAVQPVVVTEARLWILLKEIYKIDRHLRAIAVRFASLRDRRTPPPGAVVRDGERATPGRMRALDPSRGGLVDVEGSGELAEAFPEEAGPQPLPPSVPMPAEEQPLVPPLQLGEELEPQAAPAEASPVAAPPAGPPGLELPSFTRDLLARLAVESGRPPGPADGRPPAPPRRAADDAGPLDHRVALSAVQSAGDRDTLAGLIVRHARGRFSRAVLLSVGDREVRGRLASVPGVSAERIRALALPLAGPGIVGEAACGGLPIERPLAHSEADVALMDALGGGAPLRGAAVPISARGRVVDVLYVDRGPGGAHDHYALDEVVAVAAAVSRRYDALLGRA